MLTRRAVWTGLALAATILWFLYRPESSQYYNAVSGPPR